METNPIIETITSQDASLRNRTAEELLDGKPFSWLLDRAKELERFLKDCSNLYQRVRACLFLFALYRFYLPAARKTSGRGFIPHSAARQMLSRNWAAAIRLLRPALKLGAADIVLSALAEAYYRLAFSYLLDQIHDSISRAPGNEWLYRLTSIDNYPLRVPDELAESGPDTGLHPLGYDCCPVRIDPCHSGWSDIFFLAMDYPEGARVINLSVDIARQGTGAPRPPIECYSRVIDRAAIRLVSLDLGIVRNITTTTDLFDFGLDRLGLLKAGVIAAGIVPPAFKDNRLAVLKILRRMLGRGRGIELVTRVRDLPPGSRMAVSTTLLAAIITRLMRQTGQITSPEGELSDKERRLVASRAILGEWLGGSGGGWQDSGALWPGIKLIEGVPARNGDPEYGISRGRLLPEYRVIPPEELPPRLDEILRESVVLVHGGLARDVGPVLELVTDKYLLRYRREWEARVRESGYFDRIVAAIRRGDMAALGAATTEDWERGTKRIIPWATDAYTEELIARVRERWGDDYRGFLMLGGQAGGGMAFIFNPAVHRDVVGNLEQLMGEVKRRYERALPFAMEPAIFDFTLNNTGIRGELRREGDALLPEDYYRLILSDPSFRPEAKMQIPPAPEVERARRRYGLAGSGPEATPAGGGGREEAAAGFGEPVPPALLRRFGFDAELHARNRKLYREGEIGLARNRLPEECLIEDAGPEDVTPVPREGSAIFRECRKRGEEAIREGKAAVVTFGAGLGSRWAGGADMVKLLNPFLMMEGRHRSFLEIHLAKTAKTGRDFDRPLQHALTTSFLTHDPIAETLSRTGNFGSPGPVYLSPSRSIIQRLCPREDDLREFWKPRLRLIHDPEQRKIARQRVERLVRWAAALGPGEDFNGNVPRKRFYPPGHWYEIPGLIRNGTLGKMIIDNPGLNYLLVHNADTLGASLDPLLLGLHILKEKTLSFEVVPRFWGDRGGFLARIDGDPRIIEAGCLPREEDEFLFSYYNSLTTWITIDRLLSFFWLTREDLKRAADDPDTTGRVENSLGEVEQEIPVYVTLKETPFIWGGGRTEMVPVVQCERLWGEMSRLPGLPTGFIAVARNRGRQLKDPHTLDNWIRDGARDYLAGITFFPDVGK